MAATYVLEGVDVEVAKPFVVGGRHDLEADAADSVGIEHAQAQLMQNQWYESAVRPDERTDGIGVTADATADPF